MASIDHITDSCPCGAQFVVSSDVVSMTARHDAWLAAHRVCRERVPEPRIVLKGSDEPVGEVPTIIVERKILGIHEAGFCGECGEGIYAGMEATRTRGGFTFCHECASGLV